MGKARRYPCSPPWAAESDIKRQVLRRDVEGLPLARPSCLPERCDRAEFIAVYTHVLSMCADDDFIYVFQDLILRYEATFHRYLRLKNRTKASDTQHHT